MKKQNNLFRLIKFGFVFSIILSLLLVGLSYFLWMQKRNEIVNKLDGYYAEINGKSKGPKPIKIYDQNKKLIGEFYRKSFRPIRKDNLYDHSTLIWALLSSEDREFYEHRGVNISAILRAVVVNLTKLKLSQGGSTISQQLAKVSLEQLETNSEKRRERNLLNKLTEIFCTIYIETHYDKDTILAMYMNQIYMGEGNIGLEEAARFYFEKPASEVSEAEAAMLIGIIPAPSVYNPMKKLKVALNRQKMVMHEMAKNKHLYKGKKGIDSDFNSTIDTRIKKFQQKYVVKTIKEPKQEKVTSNIGKYGYDKQYKVNLAPDFNESIRKFIFEKFTQEEIDKKDLSVYTTLDIQKQKIADIALKEGIDSVKEDIKKGIAKLKKEDEIKLANQIIDSMNGSLISMKPSNGNIEALVGSYRISSVYRLNRAENVKRQPGSTIKALVYTMALEKKLITPSTIVKDEKITIGKYSPKNWYGGYKGDMTARQALSLSVNTIPVKLMQEIGVNAFVQKLADVLSIDYSTLKERLGKDNINLSLALGSGELSPIELATIYSTIANGGYRIKPKRILKIEDGSQTIYEEPEAKERERVLDPIACAMVINMMEGVLKEGGTMPVKLKDAEIFPLAAKSGTVQIPRSILKKWGNRSGVRDAWFVGILPSDVSTVWIGSDSGAPFPGSGSGTSGRAWMNYAMYVKRNLGINGSIIPPLDGSFVQVDVCADNGKLLSEEIECKSPLLGQYYYAGTEPKKEDTLTVAPISFEGLDGRQEGTELEEPEHIGKEDSLSEEDNLIKPYDNDKKPMPPFNDKVDGSTEDNSKTEKESDKKPMPPFDDKIDDSIEDNPKTEKESDKKPMPPFNDKIDDSIEDDPKTDKKETIKDPTKDPLNQNNNPDVPNN